MRKIVISKILIIVIVVLTGIVGYSLLKQRVNPSVSLPPSEGSTLVGVLTVVDENCRIPEGCGPKYKLWDSEFKNFTPLRGDLKDSDSGLLIEVRGEKVVLPPEEYGDLNYRGPYQAIEIDSYTTLTSIPYNDFLVKKGGEYTIKKYSCLAEKKLDAIFTDWNKSFSWEIFENTPVLKVRMTNTFTDETPQPFYELWYDGISGDFIREVTEPENADFCLSTN